MTEVTKETVTTEQDTSKPTVVKPTKYEATSSQTIGYIVYFLFGALEILLAFRFVLKLTGASLGSGFVSFIYGATSLLIAPFEGIFRMWFGKGSETTAVFEPSTLVAIIVYAVLAWGVVKLISIFSGEQQPTE